MSVKNRFESKHASSHSALLWNEFDHYGFFSLCRLGMCSYLHGPKAVQGSLSGSTGKHWNLIMFQKICIIGLTLSLDINREERWVTCTLIFEILKVLIMPI